MQGDRVSLPFGPRLRRWRAQRGLSQLGLLNFITTVTVFGAPHDVTLSELAVGTWLPADAATAVHLREVHATLG